MAQRQPVIIYPPRPWTPRIPLTFAERYVDFEAHNRLIVHQRMRVEMMATPSAKRLAIVAFELSGLNPQTMLDKLEQQLDTGLDAVVGFGYRSARREIRTMRQHSGVKVFDLEFALPTKAPVRARLDVPDAGHYAEIAKGGLPAIKRLVKNRARSVAFAIATAVTTETLTHNPSQDEAASRVAALSVALRSLHNHVLELVGESLNLGRTAGALSLAPKVEFALRSEQLDNNTCDLCTRSHGEIYRVGSNEYFANLPPSNCLGGGRCRGIMVFGDGPADMRGPEPSEQDLSQLRRAA